VWVTGVKKQSIVTFTEMVPFKACLNLGEYLVVK